MEIPHLLPKLDFRLSRTWMINTLYAHRGFHNKPSIPENSIPAFRRAIERGYGAEFDVHLISDGSLVVFHDNNLERCTGVDGIIEDCTLPELKELSLEGTYEKIPTFQEVLNLFKNNPGPDGKICPLIIELKTSGGNHEALVKAVCDVLDTYPGPYVIESFDPNAVLDLRKLRPDIERGQLVDNFVRFKFDGGLSRGVKRLLQSLAFDFVTWPDFVAFRFTARDSVGIKRAVKSNRVTNVAWTIKTPGMYKEAVKEGYIIIFEGFDPADVEI